MAKKIATILLVLLLIPVLSFAQEKQIKKKAPLKIEPEFVGVTTPLGTDVPVTAANYIAVDTMSNSFGPASGTINPVAVDPYSNIAAVVHRGNANTYALGSGEIWWNYTQDNGVTWPRSETSVQNNLTSQIFGRYPSMTIQNPTGSTNMADLVGAFSWAELNASGAGFENLGYGVSSGLMMSDYAAIIPPSPNLFGSNAPTWADDQYVYWASDNQTDAGIQLFRTQDFITVDIINPPTWISDRFGGTGNITMGGVAYNGVLYYAVSGSFTEEIGEGGWEVGYSKSTDNGTTWSDWFVVDWTQIPATANYIELWDWLKGDGFVSYAGDFQVDKDGFVHILCGLTDTTGAMGGEIGYNAVVEFFEIAEGDWDVKIIAEGDDVHDNSIYEAPLNAGGYNQDPAVGQNGPSFMIATNMDRDFFVAQWDIGSPETADTVCDIYYTTRELTGEWTAAVNLTETNTMNEDGSHLAPYLATVVEGSVEVDYAYSMFWYEAGNTDIYVDPIQPSVVYIAAVNVRETPIISVGNEITVYDYSLEQNYPNPFNPSTSISFTLAEKSDVTLKVYDVLGNEVATLINTTKDAGKHSVNFDATEMASGLYIYTLNAGTFTSSKKMMLLK